MIAAGLTGILGGCSQKAENSPVSSLAPDVETVVAKTGTLTQSMPLSGTLNALPQNEATLVPQVSGTLLSIAVRLGQTVACGQVIAQISSQQAKQQMLQAADVVEQDEVLVQQAEANSIEQGAQTRSAILQAQSTYKSALAAASGAQAALVGDDASLDNAQQNLDRERTLLGEGLVSQKDLESSVLALQTAKSAVEVQKKQIESQQQTVEAEREALDAAKTGTLQDLVKRKDIQIAQQQVANAEAGLEAAQAQAGLYTIRSPLAGTVTFVGASLGETVDTTTKLVTVASLGTLQIVTGVPSASSSQVQPGQQLTFTSDLLPGKTFSTIVETVSPQVDTVSGTVPVYAQISNPTGILKDDMTVQTTITESVHKNVIIVPQSAVLNDSATGLKTVGIIGADSTLHLARVTTGLSVGDQVEIVSGVTAGQQIVVSGDYGLSDGAKVSAKPVNDTQDTPHGP